MMQRAVLWRAAQPSLPMSATRGERLALLVLARHRACAASPCAVAGAAAGSGLHLPRFLHSRWYPHGAKRAQAGGSTLSIADAHCTLHRGLQVARSPGCAAGAPPRQPTPLARRVQVGCTARGMGLCALECGGRVQPAAAGTSLHAWAGMTEWRCMTEWRRTTAWRCTTAWHSMPE